MCERKGQDEGEEGCGDHCSSSNSSSETKRGSVKKSGWREQGRPRISFLLVEQMTKTDSRRIYI